jgi:hypothetical protein
MRRSGATRMEEWTSPVAETESVANTSLEHDMHTCIRIRHATIFYANPTSIYQRFGITP